MIILKSHCNIEKLTAKINNNLYSGKVHNCFSVLTIHLVFLRKINKFVMPIIFNFAKIIFLYRLTNGYESILKYNYDCI